MLLPVLVVSLNLKAQTGHGLTDAEFTISGTSSLHDWTMTTQSAEGEAIINTEDEALKSIQNLSVAIKAESLKSGRSGMDNNAYKALKTNKHPDIRFSLKQIKSIEKKDGHYLVEAEGTLTIAGETKTVNVQAEAHPVVNTLKLTGSTAFKMTDFKIDPPTALLGTVKTGDEITINYNLTFKSQ